MRNSETRTTKTGPDDAGLFQLFNETRLDERKSCAFAGVFSWNAPKKAINPYLDPADVAPVSALSNLITLYAADNEQEQLRREALNDEVWERYFFNESRDPVQRKMEQDQLISRAKMAREQQRFNPDLVILANVSAEPAHVSKPLLERIKFFQVLARPKAYSRYLRETIRPCLERLECVRESQVSASFRFMASHEGLEGLLILPEMNQDQVKRLSTLVAAHMSLCLDAACSDLFVTDDVKPEQIRQSWEKVAAEAMRLDVIPPAFEQLRRKKRRRKPVPYDLIPGSLARMLCADWWYRKLWQMRCEWREEQLRAVCLVNKKASPYVSYEAVIHKREQRRKSLEFFQSHELVNADGDTLDMEDVVNASSSNPAHRRNEMMACVKGLDLIAEMRGDCAGFYTITCLAWGKKELRELNMRLRLVKTKRRKGYKQEIGDQQRLKLEYELRSRGFEGGDREIELLLRGGSIPSGAGLRLFYRNQRLQEDDKWRQWY